MCAAVPLFHLGRDAEVGRLALPGAPRAGGLAGLSRRRARAARATGREARACLEMFLAEMVEKITFGRPPEPGEPVRWILQVSAFRRSEDVERLTRGLELAGLSPDPDERRAVNGRAGGRSSFRCEKGRWTLAFEGEAVELSDAKGLHDLAQLLAQPRQALHCLELAGRSDEPTGDAPVLDDRARREIGARVRELQETHRRGRGRSRPGSGRARPRGAGPDRGPALRCAGAGRRARAGWEARPSGLAAPSPGGSATRSGRSPASTPRWGGTSTTRSAPGPTARTFRSGPSSGRSEPGRPRGRLTL